MGNGQDPASTTANPEPPHGPAGYVAPEEQALREAQDKQYGEAMNSVGARVYRERQQKDAAVNAAAAGGGYVLDIDAMRRLLPHWQSIAKKLNDAITAGEQLRSVAKPAEDEASDLQKQAADAHADAYVKSLKEQWSYASGYQDRLQAAIDAYEKQEQAALENVRKHGSRR